MYEANRTTNILIAAIVVVQILDIIIHVATDQIEPIRIASNVIIMGWLALLFVEQLQDFARQWFPASVVLYAILNGIFLLTEGIVNETTDQLRFTLFILVGLTLGLSGWLWRKQQ